MKLNKVKYCLDCHEVWNGRDNTDCPACASVAVVWLKRWLVGSREQGARSKEPEWEQVYE